MQLKTIITNLVDTLNHRVRITYTPVRWLTKEQEEKGFVDKPTPFKKPRRQCIICKHKIQLDYRNPRLLSQFISSLNGEVFDKHITGLCEHQQTLLQREVKKAKSIFMMPISYKHPKFNRDPKLFNPDRPQRPNPY